MAAISELLQVCLAQFTSLINSGALSDHTEVPLCKWKDELGRLRVWAANIGAHQTRQSSLNYRLRDASHIKNQIVRLLERVQELLTDLKDVLEEESNDESRDDIFENRGVISESEDFTTEIQEIHQGLFETIIQLYQMSMIIRRPAQHDRLVGTNKQDSEPFQFWAKQHISNKHPNADAVAIDRISSAMARQRATLKYRERHHTKLSQGIDSESDGKSTMLSETVVTDVFQGTPGHFSDNVSDTGASESSYGGTLLEGTGADDPKIPPIPKSGAEHRPFECPYCFYIITVRDKRAWARHIFRDLMPYVCILPGCSKPSKLYEGRREWYHHVRQIHTSTFSADGVYVCSICNQGSITVATFQRHVGRHLEELALFSLPRTNSVEDEDTVTTEEKGAGGIDDNHNDRYLDGYAVEQSIEQRDDMSNAVTPASNSDPSDINPVGWPRDKTKHYTSSVGTNLSDRELAERLESNVEYKKRASSSSYNFDHKLDMEQKPLEKSDFGQDMEIRTQKQEMRVGPRNPWESLKLREEEEWQEDEISDRAEEGRRNVERNRRLKGLKEAEKEAAEREEMKQKRREENLKEISKQNEEEERERRRKESLEEDNRKATEDRRKQLALKAAAVEEWKLEQEYIKERQGQEATKKDKEFRERLRIEFGYTEEEVKLILGKEEKTKEKKDAKEATWIKIHRKHLLPETLVAYNLPWGWDEHDSNHIVIKRWITEDFQEELFAHTRRLRGAKLDAQTSSSTTDLKVNDRYEEKMFLVRKKGRNNDL